MDIEKYQAILRELGAIRADLKELVTLIRCSGVDLDEQIRRFDELEKRLGIR